MLNRPYAFVQWTKKAKIPEKYVLMAEPDHVFLRPLPNFMTGDAPGAHTLAGSFACLIACSAACVHHMTAGPLFGGAG